MRKIIALAIPALSIVGLAACGGVDRDGSREQFIEAIESAGGTADGDCVDEVLDQYSDDELLDMEDQAESGDLSDEAMAMMTELQACITIGS